MLQLIPVLPLTFVAVMVTMAWYRSHRTDGRVMLVWWQKFILLTPFVIYGGLWLLGVTVGLTVLLMMLGLAVLAYVMLGKRYRQQTDNLQSDRLPVPVVVADRPTMPKEDLQKLQGIFSIDSFYATNISNYQDGAIVKGNLHTDALTAYKKLSGSLQRLLDPKYELFLVEGQDRRPLVVVLPHRPVGTTNWWQKGLSVLLVTLTAAASMLFGDRLWSGLFFTVGLSMILVVREVALRWTANRHQVKVSLPFALPSLQLGSFGVFSRFLTPLPNRQVLFDLAISPALASGAISLVMLVCGLLLSAGGSGTVEVPSQVFQASALIGLLAKLFLGDSLHVNFVSIHPLALIGWAGMTITALNLLPAGQLDGGRIVQAIYGRRTASWTTILSLLFLMISSILNPVALYWGVIVLLLLRDLEAPMFNELAETDADRDAFGLMALFWMLIILLPITPTVADFLQIGG